MPSSSSITSILGSSALAGVFCGFVSMFVCSVLFISAPEMVVSGLLILSFLPSLKFHAQQGDVIPRDVSGRMFLQRLGNRLYRTLDGFGPAFHELFIKPGLAKGGSLLVGAFKNPVRVQEDPVAFFQRQLFLLVLGGLPKPQARAL